ncbi:uncharacterized protein Tco025E_04678 [Trypanosoma conorhini]|uniref:WWE domain-containing protein n=1 Tax=Trypanosoma conorhini TaxID=83891 RepID=A0A3S5ITI9_9TRYP|nr:uncharacterized protein Tco025E_04678 [Trypanosoma conorhini]RNF18019.1 hypothetical protein Tco025E_04678 [Trypanosoma conorhini]
MGSGGSTGYGKGRNEAKAKSEVSRLEVTDYTKRPLHANFGRAIMTPRILSALPPPPPPAADDDDQYAWFLEDLDRPGEWEAYPAEVSERLDAAWSSGQRECIILTKMRRVCTVDLGAMVQLASGSSGRPRKVKRVAVEKCGDSTVREKRHVAADPFLEEALEGAGGEVDGERGDGAGPGGEADAGDGEDAGADAARLPRLLRSVVTHSNTPFTIVFSPSGRELLTGTREELLRWDVETAVVLTQYGIQSSTVLAAAYSADGNRMACAGNKNVAWLFDTNSPEAALSFKGHTQKIYGVGFLAGEQRLVTGAMDKTVRCWDVQTATCVLDSECHTAPIFALTTSKLSDWLALSGGDDHVVCAHDFRVGNDSVTARFLGHRKTIWTCAFRGDEQQFASSGIDRILNIWDLRRPSEPLLKICHHMQPVHYAEYLPHNRGILTCARDGTVRLTDAGTGEPVWRAKAHIGYVFRASYHAETRMMATSGGDGKVNLWRYDNADKW